MSTSAPEGWPRYRLYGITLASDFPFANRLMRTESPPELTFARVATAPDTIDFAALSPVYSSPSRGPDQPPVIQVYVRADEEFEEVVVVRFAGTADHYLYPEGIICHCLVPDHDYLIEIQLLGYVLSLWLESQGIVALHASAVVIQGRAVAFLASNKGGKSALAASFMQAGCPLLTDDILTFEQRAHEIVARPSYPQVRLWPEEAEHFLGSGRAFETVHPAFSKLRIPVGADGLGSLQSKPTPLACVCLPERREDAKAGVDIEPVPPREAFAHLLRHSFAAEIVDALGWQSKRLAALAATVSTVPAWRLRYPQGLEKLTGVRRELLRMLLSK